MLTSQTLMCTRQIHWNCRWRFMLCVASPPMAETVAILLFALLANAFNSMKRHGGSSQRENTLSIFIDA